MVWSEQNKKTVPIEDRRRLYGRHEPPDGHLSGPARDATPQAEELELLIVLVKDYDERHYALPSPDPLAIIKLKMEERGLKAKDLRR